MGNLVLDWATKQLADPEFRRGFDLERAAEEFSAQLDEAERRSGVTPQTQPVDESVVGLTLSEMVTMASSCGYELHVVLLKRGDGPGPVWLTPDSVERKP